jgi:hypothetical protein
MGFDLETDKNFTTQKWGQDSNCLRRWHGLPVFIFQFVALMIAAGLFRQALNPDAVAYLQIAQHYVNGETSLAISGHWSPLISWIIAIFLKLGLPPLFAARLFMILSAMIFLLGCLRLFRQFKISGNLLIWGMWMAALLSIPWSVENITPDLLLGGLTCFAFAEMISTRWFLKSGPALLCGVLWGLAYFSKSVALPLGALTALGMMVMWWKKERRQQFQIIRAFALTMAGMTLVASIWIGVLTTHYGKMTVANSAGYNHSLVGPGVTNQLYLLDQGLRIPQPGRITIWEDPTSPFPDWSPLASWNNAKLQLQILLCNVPVVIFMLTSICLAFPALLAVVIVRLFRRDNMGDESNVWWAMLPVVLLAVLFLPNYLLVTEQRYFYCTTPLLFVVATGCRWRRGFAPLLAACFLIPIFARAGLYLNSTRTAGEYAVVLAEKISAKHLAGSLVGSGKLPGGRTGLYLAWYLQQPWYGDEPSPAAADYKSIGVKLIVVNRGSAIALELAGDKSVLNLDDELFGSAEKAGTFPLQVFENLSPALTSP